MLSTPWWHKTSQQQQGMRCAAAGHSGGDRAMALHARHPAAARPRQWRRGGSGVGSEGHRVHRTWMRSRVGVAMVANYSLTFQSYFSAFAKFRVRAAQIMGDALHTFVLTIDELRT